MTKRITLVKCPHCSHAFECDGTNKFTEFMGHILIKHPEIAMKNLNLGGLE